jgi:hypothetical protein
MNKFLKNKYKFCIKIIIKIIEPNYNLLAIIFLLKKFIFIIFNKFIIFC